MSMPGVEPLLLPVLRMIADGCSVRDIRERVRVKFEVNPDEMSQKQRNGVPVWHNRIAWALANLVMAEAITLKSEGVYEIAERGVAILGENPSDLTIKSLQ